MNAGNGQYIHERAEWPRFHWDFEAFAEQLAAIRHRQGRLLGRMEGFGFQFQRESLLKTLTQDVLKTSEIEGELLDMDQVRSSLARKMGLEQGGLKAADRHVDGVVDMTLDATGNFHTELTTERLFRWHGLLFPEGHTGLLQISVGRWRDDRLGPMQVVSGPLGRQRVHYQAPAAARIEREMEAFLDWFNRPNDTDWVMKAAQAHLWFVTIHPFEDGNGRIARALADLALARSEQSSQRFYSMSAQIRQERDAYYTMLEQTQKGPLDVTRWVRWFLGCMGRAIEGAQASLSGVLNRAAFWESLRDVDLNQRQRNILTMLLEDFKGKLTTGKWAILAKCSQDTALRDILPLIELGILTRSTQGGRSTSYALAAPPAV